MFQLTREEFDSLKSQIAMSKTGRGGRRANPICGRGGIGVGGGFRICTKSGVMERINLQREGSKAKPYQIRQVRKILSQYKLL
jgi:hypothetical protein